MQAFEIFIAPLTEELAHYQCSPNQLRKEETSFSRLRSDSTSILLISCGKRYQDQVLLYVLVVIELTSLNRYEERKTRYPTSESSQPCKVESEWNVGCDDDDNSPNACALSSKAIEVCIVKAKKTKKARIKRPSS